MIVTRTYLSIARPDDLIAPRAAETPLVLYRETPCTTATWRALYAQIGGPWHWHDRDTWTDDVLQTHLDRASVRVFVVRLAHETGPAIARTTAGGMLELEQHADGSVEIVYLGLDRRLMGQGLGVWLVTGAVREAFAWSASHVWLHTCTLDAPAALPNYLARGFVITRTEQYEATLPD